MDDDLIKAFLAIVNHGSISAAAEASFTTESRLSKKLQKLEEQTGTSLIQRKRGMRHIILTPQGEQFLSLARQQQMLDKEMTQLGQPSSYQEISIGAIDLMNTLTLKNFYRFLLSTYPHLKLDLHTRHSTEMYSLIHSHSLDIAFTSILLPSKGLTVTPLYQEPMVVLTSTGSFHEGPLFPEDLNPDLEVYAAWSDSYRLWHDALWPGSRYRLHAGTGSMIPDYLSEPGRWAVVPASILRATPSLESHPLTIDTPKQTFFLLEPETPRPSRTDTVCQFKKDLLSYLKEDPNIKMLL